MKLQVLWGRSRFFFVYAGLTILVITNVLFYHSVLHSQAPAGTVYSYTYGHTGDFYQYVSIIKSGREGHLLYHNQFSEENYPIVPLHPFLHLIGFLSRPFPLNPFIILFSTRIISLTLFFFSVYFIIRNVFTSFTHRVLAAILFFFSTNFWTADWTNGKLQIVNPVLYSDYFSIVAKMFRIPPHHFLAFFCFITVLLLLSRHRITPLHMFCIFILTVSIGLLQPYVLFLLCIFIGCALLVNVIKYRKISQKEVIMAVLISIGGIVLLYYIYIIKSVLRGSTEGILSWLPLGFPLSLYLQGLGPLIILAPFSLLFRTYWEKPFVRFLFIWAFLPIGLFLLPVIHIPSQTTRLFQIYQQLPLAILATITIGQVSKTLKHPMILITLVGIAAFFYGAFPLAVQEYDDLTSISTNNMVVYTPDYILQSFSFLQNNTAKKSVVLTGETISMMIPAFTDNRVMIGHEGDTHNYPEKLALENAFFNNTLSEKAVRTFLRDHHISYIIFGIDAPPYESSSYKNFPEFRKVYSDGIITIVRVDEDSEKNSPLSE